MTHNEPSMSISERHTRKLFSFTVSVKTSAHHLIQIQLCLSEQRFMNGALLELRTLHLIAKLKMLL